LGNLGPAPLSLKGADTMPQASPEHRAAPPRQFDRGDQQQDRESNSYSDITDDDYLRHASVKGLA